MALLEVKNLSIGFRNGSRLVPVVSDVSFSLDAGKVLALVGESGCGKSISCLALTSLLPPRLAEVSADGIVYEMRSGEKVDLTKLSPRKMRRVRGGEIAYIFQEPAASLNPVLTVGKQIVEVLELHRPELEDPEPEAIRLLEQVGIPAPETRLRAFPHELSGGMQQRVMIAMGLMLGPDLVIADEPTTALDVTIQAQVLELIKKLQQSEQTSMLLITHDLGIVAETCDTVAIMYAGHLVEYADIKSLYTNPKHPYTQGLFNAVPTLESPLGSRLAVIPGLPPDPTNLPKGCSFSPRCPYAKDICHEQACGMREVEPGHFVDCHFPLTPESGNKFLERPGKEAE